MRDAVVDTRIIKDAVMVACRAPSLHNSQPWRWVAAGRTVELFVDPDRAPRHADTSGREALIACGAVLDHFRVAMASAGWTANVDRFPNPNDLHHLASVDFSPLAFVTDGHRRRADAILLRRTDRLPFAAAPDWESVEPRLRSSVNTELVRIDVVDDDLRPELAKASHLTESLRLYDSSYHSELEWWTSDFSVREGIPHSSLISADERYRVDVGRDFPATHNRERRREVGEDHSKIMVLSTYDDSHCAILQCGEVLSAVLLDATLAGLATCTLTHVTELPASQQVVATLIGQPTTPQVLVRIGLAPALDDIPPATPRRPIDEVFEVRTDCR
jgi:hypothetical protein